LVCFTFRLGSACADWESRRVTENSEPKEKASKPKNWTTKQAARQA
jgi:hypothetical protein